MITREIHTTSKKALAVIVALAVLLAMAPMQAWEAFADSGKSGGNVIDMSDNAPDSSTAVGWTYADDVYTILDGAEVAVTGDNGESQRRLEVATGAAVKITLKGVTIGATINEEYCPLKLNPGANVALAIEGTNSLVSGGAQAGINAPEGTVLSISGDGELTAATASESGAGIGGRYGENGGKITISGGTVNATGSYGGAGIGGGYDGDGGTITISGGTVNATTKGGSGGAGIGGGVYGDGGTITISGGTVNAITGDNGYGAGIGGGYYGNGGDIIICGEAAVTATGWNNADDIGGGFNGSNEPDPGNQFIAADDVNGDPAYEIKGNPTIPAGITANIPADQTMTVPSGSALTVRGTIDVYGELALENHKSGIDNQWTINIYGKLANDGTLTNDGSITIESGGELANNGTLTNNDSITIEKGGEYTGNTPTGNPVKYAGADVSQPTVNGEPTETTISVNAVDLLSDTGQQIEYAISTGQAEPNDEWLDDTEFTGLTAGTTYYVSARSKANDTYNAGKRSMSDPIATKTDDTPDTPVTPVTPSTNATKATTAAKNVTAIRTPLKAIHMQRGTTLTPPVCADSKDPVTKKPHITAKLTWSSSNPKIATVNAATGKIKAKKAGKAKITARALNGRKLTITVNVVKNAVPLKTIRLKKAPNSLNVGKARLLSVKTTPYQATNLNVTFSSSNRNIVSVDKAGKITAKKKGQAKITVRVNGKKSAKMITVK